MQVDKKQDYIKDFLEKSTTPLIVCHNNGSDSLASGISLKNPLYNPAFYLLA
jgi:hypothetical protein